MDTVLEQSKIKFPLTLHPYQPEAVEFTMKHVMAVLAMCANGGKTEIAISSNCSKVQNILE